MPLSGFGERPRAQSPAHCVMLRSGVVLDLNDVAVDLAGRMAPQNPGMVTLVLVGGFRFWRASRRSRTCRMVTAGS